MTRESTMRRFLALRPHLVPSLIAAGFCLGAMGRWPYGYYKLLRWVVCAAAVFMFFFTAKVTILVEKQKPWRACFIGLFVLIAVTYNPLDPIHTTRELWQVVDIVVAAAFIAGIPLLSKPEVNP